jgi:probable HAF family extracellular repeat protein
MILRSIGQRSRSSAPAAALLASLVAAPAVAQTMVVDITPDSLFASGLSDINNRGQAVGKTALGSGDNERAILWQDGVLIELGVLPGANESLGAAINEAGVVIGMARATLEDRSTAFRWADGTMLALPMPPGSVSTHAFDINAAGTIVGMATGPSGDSPQPVVWRGPGVTPLSGTWGSVIGEARGINNRGDVVGVTYGGIGGYVWSDGIFKPLTSPYGSLPQAISDRGTAVGLILTEGGSPVHGAVWGKALTRIQPRIPAR